MGGERPVRRRAVRLTKEGLDVLNEALLTEWAKTSEGRKLTREQRAELLGLSVGTSTKVLRGTGVDRSTLSFAFKSLGLAWNNSLCEPAHALDDGLPPTSTAPTSVIEPHTPFWIVALGGRRSLTWAWTFAGLAFLGLLTFFIFHKQAPLLWKDEFNDLLAEGDLAYHQGRYEKAEHSLGKAIAIARRNEGAGHLAGALKTAGDLAVVRGSFADAKSRYEEALTLRHLLGQRVCNHPSLRLLGMLKPSLETALVRNRCYFRQFKDFAAMEIELVSHSPCAA